VMLVIPTRSGGTPLPMSLPHCGIRFFGGG
jgi:hypothetical protein